MCQNKFFFDRKVLNIAKAHMIWGTCQGAPASIAWMAGVSIVSIWQADDWDSFYSN